METTSMMLCVEKFPASLVDGDFSPFLEMTQGLADDHQKKVIEKRAVKKGKSFLHSPFFLCFIAG